MKVKSLIAWAALLVWGLTAATAQTLSPKREFRGAWIQCVNGQFQGMPVQTMKATLVRQLDHLRKTGMPYEMICMTR